MMLVVIWLLASVITEFPLLTGDDGFALLPPLAGERFEDAWCWVLHAAADDVWRDVTRRRSSRDENIR